MSFLPNIYIINLQRSVERRAAILAQAEKMGFDPIIFTGVDAGLAHHDLFSRVNIKKRLRYKGRAFKPGELGAWASHYQLWELCVAKSQTILVLEDDVLLRKNFMDFLPLAEQLAERFSYLRLMQSSAPSRLEQDGEKFRICRYLRSPLGAYGYLLSPLAAQKLMDHAQEWILPVDDYMDLAWLHGVENRGLQPGCVYMEERFVSTIQEQAPKERLSFPALCIREAFRAYLSVHRTLHNLKGRGITT
ncbi:MAG: glycosyltransferase family 25 protein [Chromatocurvus sp.]